RPTATIDLCDRAGCAGQPAGVACDDGDPCTTDDRCTGGEQGTCRGTRATCDGPCETGVCDPVTGCVRKPTGTSCDDGDACTVGDHCAADGACHSGNAATCTGPCLTGTCDPAHGCVPGRRPPRATTTTSARSATTAAAPTAVASQGRPEPARGRACGRCAILPRDAFSARRPRPATMGTRAPSATTAAAMRTSAFAAPRAIAPDRVSPARATPARGAFRGPRARRATTAIRV